MGAWSPKLRLISVLATTNVFLLNSTEEGWSDEDPKETEVKVRGIIAHLFDSSSPLPEYWNILFAPTGSIQEIAMSNGWHDTYMKLAADFDDLAYLLKDKKVS